MNTLAIIFIYWILSGVFGNDFIQFSVMGINTFYVLMGLCIMYWVLRVNYVNDIFRASKESHELYNSIKWFSILSLFYMFLSCFQLFTEGFNLDVDYDVLYVLRQGYLVFSIPIIFTIVNSIVKRPNYWMNIITNRKLLFNIWLVLLICKYTIGVDSIGYRPLIFAISSLYFLLDTKRISSCIVLLVSLLFLINNTQSTSIVALFIVFLIYIFWGYIVRFDFGNCSIKFWLLFIGIVLVVILSSNTIVDILINDANSMWRWQYWMNEIQVLLDTWGLGVGYGTAYASNSIYSEINNPYVFYSQTSVEGYGLFVITQHNSYMNFLYRLGVVGFILSIQAWLVNPVKVFLRSLNKSTGLYSKLVKWGLINFIYNTVIILLNPGLESPRFAIGFIFTYALMIAFCILSYQQKLENLER